MSERERQAGKCATSELPRAKHSRSGLGETPRYLWLRSSIERMLTERDGPTNNCRVQAKYIEFLY